MRSLANRPELLKITAHCMSPTAVDRVNSTIGSETAVHVPPLNVNHALIGSEGHGACVMSALSMTGDGGIHIIADSDTVIVAKGWDDYVRQRLVSDGIGIMGSTYEDPGGFSSGQSKVQTYKKVPTVTWCALSPLQDWRGLDVMPNKAHQVAITSPHLSNIYNLPEGYVVFGEVGWQIPQYVHDRGLKYDGWPQLKPSREAVVLKGLSDYHEEFHADGVPFVAHHRGSMRHTYRSDKISQQFYAAIDAYVSKELERAPRWTWVDDGKLASPFVSPACADKSTKNETQRVTVDYEWLKVSFNGIVTRPKGVIDNRQSSIDLSFEQPKISEIGHIRIEGALNRPRYINVPQPKTTPYVITCRNATNEPIEVTCGLGKVITVASLKTSLLLVDVDGIQQVS